MASAGLYLAYGAIGAKVTGHDPFFWMDEGIVGSKEKVAAYCSGFVSMSAASEYQENLLYWAPVSWKPD